MPERVVRARGGAIPEGAIYVGTGSGWGSPFYPGAAYLLGLSGKEDIPTPTLRTGVTGARTVTSWEEAFTLYRTWVTRFYGHTLERSLGGHNLACYCPAGSTTCHALILLELSNPKGTK